SPHRREEPRLQGGLAQSPTCSSTHLPSPRKTRGSIRRARGRCHTPEVPVLPLYLASASPRRRELLEAIGLAFAVRPADADESPAPGESPGEHVVRLAAAKAAAVAQALRREGALAVVLGADTTVTLDGEILGKPTDAADALAMLRRLAGRTHEVLTACRLV